MVLPELLRFTGGLYLIFYAAFVMVLLIVSPTGIFGFVDRIITTRKTKAASAARAAASATLAEGPAR